MFKTRLVLLVVCMRDLVFKWLYNIYMSQSYIYLANSWRIISTNALYP